MIALHRSLVACSVTAKFQRTAPQRSITPIVHQFPYRGVAADHLIQQPRIKISKKSSGCQAHPGLPTAPTTKLQAVAS